MAPTAGAARARASAQRTCPADAPHRARAAVARATAGGSRGRTTAVRAPATVPAGRGRARAAAARGAPLRRAAQRAYTRGASEKSPAGHEARRTDAVARSPAPSGSGTDRGSHPGTCRASRASRACRRARSSGHARTGARAGKDTGTCAARQAAKRKPDPAASQPRSPHQRATAPGLRTARRSRSGSSLRARARAADGAGRLAQHRAASGAAPRDARQSPGAPFGTLSPPDLFGPKAE